ncbi:MAG TPA: hypothetical protein VIV07_02030 [Sphingomicrobium sp.]
MMMTAVVAVALGLTPVAEGPAQTVRVSSDIAAKIGRYSQATDARGTTRVRGYDRLGRPYELTIDKHGYVEASVGDQIVSFRVSEAA